MNEHDRVLAPKVPFIRAAGVADRFADSFGEDAANDPRLREYLDAFRGRVLHEFSIAINSVTLSWWPEPSAPERQVIHRGEEVLLLEVDKDPTRLRGDSAAFATFATAALGKRVTDVDLDHGHLVVTFEHGVTMMFEPDDHYESWEIRSRDDGLFVVCGPGGDLSSWYPQRPGDEPQADGVAERPRRGSCATDDAVSSAVVGPRDGVVV